MGREAGLAQGRLMASVLAAAPGAIVEDTPFGPVHRLDRALRRQILQLDPALDIGARRILIRRAP